MSGENKNKPSRKAYCKMLPDLQPLVNQSQASNTEELPPAPLLRHTSAEEKL